MLVARDLTVAAGGHPLLRGLTFRVRPGEVVALKGPNGAGKSTLALALAGHPGLRVTARQLTFRGRDLIPLKPEQRARQGLFLAFQHPPEVPGVPLGGMLRGAVGERRSQAAPAVLDFWRQAGERCAALGLKPEFLERGVNEGFSGGERKRAEVLQMLLLEPHLAILDEVDSGLDAASRQAVADAVSTLRQAHPRASVLLITHYDDFLKLLAPDRALVLSAGRLVRETAQRRRSARYRPLPRSLPRGGRTPT